MRTFIGDPASAVEVLKELKAITGGRAPTDADILEFIQRRRARGGSNSLPWDPAEATTLLTPIMKDLMKILAEAEAAFPDGMENPAFGDELGMRVKTFMLSRPSSLGSASA